MSDTSAAFGSVLLFCVSGVIGVGKTTLMKKLQNENLSFSHPTKTVKVCYAMENSKKWEDRGWLAAFYDNPDAKALSFQLLVFDCHVKCVQKTLKRAGAGEPNTLVICIVERSMWDQLLFWKLQFDLGRETAQAMDDEAYIAMWKRWYEFIPPVSTIFFCTTEHVDTTMKRIAERARACEQTTGPSGPGVTLEYQTALLKKHEDWFKSPKATFTLGKVETVMPCVRIATDAPTVDVSLIRETIEKFVRAIK